MAPEKDRRRQAEDDILDWFTISYKTLYIGVGILGLLAAGGGYYYYTRTAPPATTPPERPALNVPSARFTQIEGNVKVRRTGSFDWVDVDKSSVLRRGDLVKTGAGAVAQISFFDDTVVDLRPDSLLTIEETSENPSTKERRVAAQISSGAVDFTAPARTVKGSETEFSTPTLTTKVGDQGARASMTVDASTGASAVSVLEGSQVVETRSGAKVNLPAGTAVKVDESGKPGAVVALPAVPVLEAPPHQAEISYVDPSRSTTLLAWKAIPGAATYHLMLDYSPRFNRPLVDRAGIKDRSQEIRGLEPGKYYWRVAAVDREGVEGGFSDTALFMVTRPAAASASGPPPPLTLEALEVRGNILQVKGRTEPGARITVNGNRVDVREDGSFNEYISLDKAGKQEVVVRSMGLNGGVKEVRRPVTVGY